ncbi:hypothetical protein BGZ96_000251 [Linnemannia gamsii]|uniref:F-box domain-containing protein n=1 Tax=Linnemannia gamsii TaxID=64522 RepID=A0ABQ7JPR7_9FUNG|nr:hypothetical protein BGZ96_000251 [Linnemannia gamsii]
MPAWASLLDLPQEIIDLILPHISHNDYASCLRVNTSWRSIFTPSLWQVMRLGDRTMHECFGTREARIALVRNSQYIRTVETTDPAFVFALACMYPTVTKLESLTLRLKDHAFSTVDELLLSTDELPATAATVAPDTKQTIDVPRCTAPVTLILKNNPNLRYVSLDVGCFRYRDGMEGMLSLAMAFPTAKLEKLELSFLNSAAYNRDINDGGDEAFDTESFAQYYLAKHNPFPALKEVIITGGGQNCINPNRLNFLLRCHNLETARLHRLDSNAMKALIVFLRTGCPKLTTMEWRKGLYDPEEFIVGLLQASKLGWKELRLPDMPEFGTDAWEALMQHVGTLEVLRLESAEHIPTNAVLNLLCSARKLKRLEGIADRQRKRFTRELSVHAHDAFREHLFEGSNMDWVLGPSVEHLQLHFDCVPRPDVLYRLNGGEFGFHLTGLNPEWRYPAQNWIYIQLSRMTGLQELVVGLQELSASTVRRNGVDWSMDTAALEEALPENDPRVFNYLSLEFSLECGLGLLSGLKEMRMLDVRSTAHNIGVAELEWMHTNWPKLERISGLESDRRWSIHHEDGPAAKTAVEEWMAAHPRGIGSSFYQ